MESQEPQRGEAAMGPMNTGPMRAKPGRQPVKDVGPLEYSELDDLDKRLVAARETFPELDIYRVAWGYLAVPGGIDVYGASDIDALVEKLHRRQEQPPQVSELAPRVATVVCIRSARRMAPTPSGRLTFLTFRRSAALVGPTAARVRNLTLLHGAARPGQARARGRAGRPHALHVEQLPQPHALQVPVRPPRWGQLAQHRGQVGHAILRVWPRGTSAR